MSELSSAIKSVCDEKGLEYEAVLNTIELSLAAAYRKDYGHKNQNIKVNFDPETGNTEVMDVKTVVEDLPEEEQEDPSTPSTGSGQAGSGQDSSQDSGESKQEETPQEEAPEEEEERKFNPKTEIQLSDARMIKEDAEVGEEIKIELEVPESYGRMAAQTAKQVIIQKLRESEREMIFNEFKEKEQEVVNGIVQRREGRNLLVDLGKAIGYLPAEEQIARERHKPGERIKVYIKEVESHPKGPRITLSRTSQEIVRTLFYLEIPELASGMIEIKSVAREAGSRSKVAVWTESENIDPIGSCVGQKGSRIQTIINELGGEKVDIIEYDEDPSKFVANSLSPAKVLSAEVDEDNGVAYIKVASDQFSLAIGKRGENIRLASALTGWKINVQEDEEGMTEESSPKEYEEVASQQEEVASEDETQASAENAEEGEKKTEDKNEAEQADSPEGEAEAPAETGEEDSAEVAPEEDQEETGAGTETEKPQEEEKK